jgi:hypothetical protein
MIFVFVLSVVKVFKSHENPDKDRYKTDCEEILNQLAVSDVDIWYSVCWPIIREWWAI